MSSKTTKEDIVTGYSTVGSLVASHTCTAVTQIGKKINQLLLKQEIYIQVFKCLLFVAATIAGKKDGNCQVANFGNAYIPQGGNVAVSGDYTNTAEASYQNNGNLYISGNFSNNQVNMPSGVGTTNFMGTALQKIFGNQPSYFYNLLLNNSSDIQMARDIYVNNIFTPKNGSLQINGNTLHITGSIDNNVSNNGTLSGSTTSSLIITGTGNLLGLLNFKTGARQLNNFTLNRTSGGVATLATDLDVYGTGAYTNGAFLINGNTLGLYGNVTGSGNGTLSGSSTSSLTIGGTSGGDLGTLYFTPGAQLLKLITLNRTGSQGRVVMGTALDLLSMNLSKGVLVTGNNLITWKNAGGSLTAPANSMPWTPGSGNKYAESYIATCDANGNPLSVAWPFNGNRGFRIDNVGNSDTYFPVSQSYTSTPNRLMLNNAYTPQSFTVVINPGDIGNTAGPRVNRVWFIKAALDTASVTMKLFFTERNPSQFLSSQDEIETGFDYSSIALVQKDFTANTNFINKSAYSDVKNFMYGAYANTEVYAQYSIGISPNVAGNKNGITGFNRFSIVNPLNIILPVTVTALTATLQNAKVKLGWTSLNELNIAGYTIERSDNATDFVSLGLVSALNNGQPRTDYDFDDLFPVNGYSYYRLRIRSTDGKISYTNIVRVNISNTIQNAFSVFPNPVTAKQFTLLMNNMPSGKYAMQLFTLTGQRVMNATISYPGNAFTQTVLLTKNITPGAYILQLTNGNKKYTQKLIVE